MLDRNSYLPLYVQIRHHLREMIKSIAESGRDEFPSDDELARKFGVSRMTVRQAVSDLVDEGLLTRVRGSGTFIASTKITEQIIPAHDFFGRMSLQGKVGRIELLSFDKQRSSASVASALQINASATVFALKRRRLVDGTLLGVDERYFPAAIGEKLDVDRLAKDAIHEVLAPHLPSPIARATTSIEAALAGEHGARELEIQATAPVLVTTVTVYSEANEPLWTGRATYLADAYKIALDVPVQYSSSDSNKEAGSLDESPEREAQDLLDPLD